MTDRVRRHLSQYSILHLYIFTSNKISLTEKGTLENQMHYYLTCAKKKLQEKRGGGISKSLYQRSVTFDVEISTALSGAVDSLV